MRSGKLRTIAERHLVAARRTFQLMSSSSEYSSSLSLRDEESKGGGEGLRAESCTAF